jgi:hypothetical protein
MDNGQWEAAVGLTLIVNVEGVLCTRGFGNGAVSTKVFAKYNSVKIIEEGE